LDPEIKEHGREREGGGALPSVAKRKNARRFTTTRNTEEKQKRIPRSSQKTAEEKQDVEILPAQRPRGAKTLIITSKELGSKRYAKERVNLEKRKKKGSKEKEEGKARL